MTELEILTAARKKIENIEHWTQGAFARSSPDGPSVAPVSSLATCFCAVGAVINVSDTNTYAELTRLLDAASTRLYGLNIQTVNDDNYIPAEAHARVLAAYDEAIRLVREGA